MTCRRLDVDDVVRDEVSDASQTFVVPSEAPETDVHCLTLTDTNDKSGHSGTSAIDAR